MHKLLVLVLFFFCAYHVHAQDYDFKVNPRTGKWDMVNHIVSGGTGGGVYGEMVDTTGGLYGDATNSGLQILSKRITATNKYLLVAHIYTTFANVINNNGGFIRIHVFVNGVENNIPVSLMYPANTTANIYKTLNTSFSQILNLNIGDLLAIKGEWSSLNSGAIYTEYPSLNLIQLSGTSESGGGSGVAYAGVSPIQITGANVSADTSILQTRWGTGRPAQITMPQNFKMPFDRLNTEILPYTLTGNITITPNTLNAFSGSTAVLTVGNDATHTYTVTLSGFKWLTGDSVSNAFTPTANKYSQYLFGCFGSGLYRNYKAVLHAFDINPVGPSQLSVPGSFTASGIDQNTIALSWTRVPNAISYSIYDSVVGVSSSKTLLTTPAQSATFFNHTGLTTGQHVYYFAQSEGNNTTYLTSAYATANATTPAITQLTTPVLNTPTSASSTQTANTWSADANVSSWKLEESLTGTSGWSVIGGSIAAGTLTYTHTVQTAFTTYYYRLTKVGNGTTFTDSNPSSVVSVTTKNIAPTLVSAATSSDGLTVSYTFSRAIANPSAQTSLFTFSPSKTVSSATLRNGNAAIIDVAVSVAFASTDAITGTIASGLLPADGGDIYIGVTNTSVTNNVTGGTTAITSTTYNSNWQNSGTVWTVGPSVGFGYFISDQTFAGDFNMIIDMVDSYWWSGYGLWIGLDVSTNTTGTGYTSWILSYNTASATSATIYLANSSLGTITFAANDQLAIKRTGTTVIIQKYSGSSWTTLYTYASPVTGTVRFKGQAYGDGTHRNKIYNPRY